MLACGHGDADGYEQLGSAISEVKAIVPLLMVTSMELSLAFYTEGMAFALKNKWTPDDPCKIRWAWLTLGTAHLMLQEPGDFTQFSRGPIGNGVSFYVQCSDALAIYRDLLTRNISPEHEPQVGNGSWEIVYADPDGYKIIFSSPTDIPEETLLSEVV